jgi:hypothetical protein
MARLARVVIPGLPHHVTQRGAQRAGRMSLGVIANIIKTGRSRALSPPGTTPAMAQVQASLLKKTYFLGQK